MLSLPPASLDTQCRYCWHHAVGHWFAQWTIVDFLEWEVCEQHVYYGGKDMALRTVEGLPVRDLYFVDYDSRY